MEEINARYDLCEAFLEAFRRCDPEMDEYNPSIMALPAIVCAAFSIEIGLKTLLETCGKQVKGHDLSLLFNSLPKHIQLQIIQGTCFSKQEFTEYLEQARSAFVEWRYIYESQKFKIVSVEFLRKFAEVLQLIVHTMRLET